MKLAFDKIEIEGFRSFKGSATLDLLKLPIGLIFMSGRNEVEPRLGSNGSGKSSVWDCLTWVLFGSTPAGLKNTDVKPWDGGKKVRGIVTVAVDDDPHTIERTANPNKLLIDGENVGPEGVVNLLGMNYDTFTQTVLMAQSRPLFLDLTPAEKMSLFVDVLGLDRWDRRSQEAATRTKNLQKVESDLQNQLASIEGALDEIDDSLDDIKQRSKNWEADRRDRLSKTEADLADAEAAQAKLQKNYDAIELEADEAHTVLAQMEDSRLKFENVLNDVNRKYQAERMRVEAKEDARKKAERDLLKLGEGDNCPTCGQTLKGTSLEKHKKELEGEIKKLAAEVKAGVPKDVTKELAKAESQVESTRREVAALRKRAESASSSRDSTYPRLTEANSRVRELKAKLEAGEDDTNPYLEQISKLRKRRAKLINDDKELDAELQEVLKDIDHHKFWIKGFRDIRLYIVDEVLEDLQLSANAMLEEMGLINWRMLFESEVETKSGTISRGINVTILSPRNEEPVRWQVWSGGEGQRLRIVGALALSEVLLNYAGLECSLEVLDEPTRHMSPEGVKDIHEFLADRADRLDKQILYVDHAAISSRHFSGSVTVVKDGDGSHIKQE